MCVNRIEFSISFEDGDGQRQAAEALATKFVEVAAQYAPKQNTALAPTYTIAQIRKMGNACTALRIHDLLYFMQPHTQAEHFQQYNKIGNEWLMPDSTAYSRRKWLMEKAPAKYNVPALLEQTQHNRYQNTEFGNAVLKYIEHKRKGVYLEGKSYRPKFNRRKH